MSATIRHILQLATEIGIHLKLLVQLMYDTLAEKDKRFSILF